MKENLVDIMFDLKPGQIILMEKQEYIFIEPKKKTAVVRRKDNGKDYKIKGFVEVTSEIDQDTVDQLEEEAVKEFIMERKIKKMQKGQCFIGSDDREYVYKKFNRSTLDCIDIETKTKYRCKVGFVKTILEKVVE